MWDTLKLIKKTLLLLVAFMGLAFAGPNDVISEGLSLPVSQKSVDLIIYYESGTREYYDKYLTRPTVPAWQTTSSGVTVCIGNDLGMMTKDQIRKAFTGVATEKEIQLMQSVSGMTGKNAYYNGLPKVRNLLRFDYNQAEKVFTNYTMPVFTKQTKDAFSLAPTTLHPHSNGALTSLVFNRGPSLANTDSRKEMRWIKYNIANDKVENVPSDILSMRRLWSREKLKGLWLRREAESRLFQQGLDTRKAEIK